MSFDPEKVERVEWAMVLFEGYWPTPTVEDDDTTWVRASDFDQLLALYRELRSEPDLTLDILALATPGSQRKPFDLNEKHPMSSWPEGPLTREQFIQAWCDARDIPAQDRFEDGCQCGTYRRYALPCDAECGYDKCQGWVMLYEDSPERSAALDLPSLSVDTS